MITNFADKETEKIYDQFRICFTVDGSRFGNVEIVDYH